MNRLAAVASLAIAAACGPFSDPPATAPTCPVGDVNIYVDQGGIAPCQLRVGQRYVVKMPRRASDQALRTVCFDVYHGVAFVDNERGGFVYCVLAGRTA